MRWSAPVINAAQADDTAALHITIHGNEQDPLWLMRLNRSDGETRSILCVIWSRSYAGRPTLISHRRQAMATSEPIFHR
ncbi:MAG: hypothetical protein KatS3mg056_2880 [Chloroflexus sp.]|nr:MAG: hypothetical protein KatS3mg056_2880 [Chloroflexus sp.]